MRTFLTVLLCASLAHAAPADAPLADSAPGSVIELKAGQLAPFAGTLVADAERIKEGGKLHGARAGIAEAKTGTLIPTPVLIGGAIAVLAVIAVAVGSAYAKGRADGHSAR